MIVVNCNLTVVPYHSKCDTIKKDRVSVFNVDMTHLYLEKKFSIGTLNISHQFDHVHDYYADISI